MRLDQLRKDPDAISLLQGIDEHGLLKVTSGASSKPDDTIDDAELLASMGIEVTQEDENDITQLRHVTSMTDRDAAEEIAGREVCRDFFSFEQLFEEVRQDLKMGIRTTRDSVTQGDIQEHNFFILHGQIAYVAEKGKEIDATGKNRVDA